MEKSVAVPALSAKKDRLGIWNLYFAVKLFLYFHNYMQFDLLWNLAFFFFLYLTSINSIKNSPPKWVIRNTLAVIAGFLLIWRDTWLPSFTYEVGYIQQYGLGTFRFILSFLGHALFSAHIVVGIVVIVVLAGLFLKYSYVRVSWFIVLGFFAVAIRQGVEKPKSGLDGQLQAFYNRESRRRIEFSGAKKNGANPDIIILQICSLAQDDLHTAGLEGNAFWKTFDIILDDFNTVTPHSGPSALRLLRATCGQLPHAALYNEAPKECSLLEQLRQLGYHTYAIMDHDGSYENFSESLQQYVRMDKPITVTDLPVSMLSFDGSPLFNDTEVLNRWWKIRQASGEQSAAVFVNLITLHVGVHAPSEHNWWNKDSITSYRARFDSLTKGILSLEKNIRKSGRKAIIIFVPEHGRALRGASIQLRNLRELPLPYITVAPVGIKFIGWNKPAAKYEQIKIDKRTSYLSLAYLLANILRQPDVVKSHAAILNLASDVPAVDFVSENQKTIIIKDVSGYYMKTSGNKWTKIPQDTFPWGKNQP